MHPSDPNWLRYYQLAYERQTLSIRLGKKILYSRSYLHKWISCVSSFFSKENKWLIASVDGDLISGSEEIKYTGSVIFQGRFNWIVLNCSVICPSMTSWIKTQKILNTKITGGNTESTTVKTVCLFLFF